MILERLVSVDRVHQRSAKSGGYSIPILHEREVEDKESPLLVTNTKGAFVQTRPSKEGLGRFAFSALSVEDEDKLLRSLWETLDRCARLQGWANHADNLVSGLDRLRDSGYTPSAIVHSNLDSPPSEWQGSSFAYDLPKGAALVFSSPTAGYYVRSGDYVGVLLQGANQRIVVVS